MSHEAQSTQVTSGAVTPSMIATIDAARSPSDFTIEYDEAVEAVETALIAEVFRAISVTLDFDAALAKLSRVAELRCRYLTLLDEAAREPGHPMSKLLPELRDYAIDSDGYRRSLQATVEAFIEFRAGRGANALRMLDQIHVDSDDPQLSSWFALETREAAEGITALIRRGALDYAGARAAYDRAAAVKQQMRTLLETAPYVDSDQREATLSSVNIVLRVYEANSLQMQYQEQLRRYDYAGAIDAALGASAAFLEAANARSGVIASIHRARSDEALAEAAMAEASMLLEDGKLDASSDLIGKVGDNYQAAALTWLKSGHPSASVMQEQLLNTGAAWIVRFRRDLGRECAHVADLAKLEAAVNEAKELARQSDGLAGRAREIVSRYDEMLSSPNQSAEVCGRLETNARALLREVPAALAAADVSPAETERLRAESLQLADDTADRPVFFRQMADFSRRLSSALGKAAETDTPVAVLLKAMAVLS